MLDPAGAEPHGGPCGPWTTVKSGPNAYYPCSDPNIEKNDVFVSSVDLPYQVIVPASVLPSSHPEYSIDHASATFVTQRLNAWDWGLVSNSGNQRLATRI